MTGGEPEGKPVGGILGLDRKAMEEERLARIAARNLKRQRSISPPSLKSRKAQKIEETTIAMESGAMLKMFTSGEHDDQQSRKTEAANAAIEHMKVESAVLPKHQPSQTHNKSGTSPEAMPQGSLKYPNGVVKRTWAFGHERTASDVKLEEVLEPLSVRTAVISAFQWDIDWILSKLKTRLNGGQTKCVFVMHAKGDEERARMRSDASDLSQFLRVCLPPMDGLIWCMHSKLMLLFHPDKLRIAIPTANMLNFDWGETGQMENSVFMIDLPRLPEGRKNSYVGLTAFGKELIFFLEKQALDEDVRDGVLSFDFSATAKMAFIHTVGGVHYRKHAERTGLLGLSCAVRELNLNADELQLDFAASSIGQLNSKYLQDVYKAAKGSDVVQDAIAAKSHAAANFFSKKGSSAAGSSSAANSTSTSSNPKAAVENMRIYFPTHDTVRASTAGAAGTLCLQRRYFEAGPFPRDCFRDYKSTRAGLLSHNKILCARGTRRADGSQQQQQVAWVYVGSANMSKSAWGELPADRKEKKITCRNWECGVLLPAAAAAAANVVVPAAQLQQGDKKQKKGDDKRPSGELEEDSETEWEEEDDDKEVVHTELPDMAIFKDLIDLPFQFPGDTYAGHQPWYFQEQQP